METCGHTVALWQANYWRSVSSHGSSILQLRRCDCDAKNQRGKPKHFCAWQTHRENGQQLKSKSHAIQNFARPVTASRWRLKVHHLYWGLFQDWVLLTVPTSNPTKVGVKHKRQGSFTSTWTSLRFNKLSMPHSHIPNTRERTAGVKGPTAIIQLRFMWEDLWIPRCFTLHETKQECAGNAEQLRKC